MALWFFSQRGGISNITHAFSRLGVWAPAAHRGDYSRSRPQVRDNQVRERSRHRRPQKQTSASPSARRELRRVKERVEGRLQHRRLWRQGFMRPPPGGLGQVSEKGGVNRDSACQILRGSRGLATRSGISKVWKSARWSGDGGAARKWLVWRQKRRQGGEMETLSGGGSVTCRRNCEEETWVVCLQSPCGVEG